jgi:hypothetical protein
MLLTPQELAAAARRQTDFDDLMLELSGFTRGGIARFLRPEQIERIRRERGLSAADTGPSHRERRYAELMADITRRLAVINRALDRAMERARKRLQETRAVLDDIRARASVSEDGRRVYRTDDRRRAFYDDGTELTREEIAKVHWRDGAPTWEQRLAAGEAVRHAKQDYEDLESCKARADLYRDRMASGDALSADDLLAMKTELDAMPEGLKAAFRGQRPGGAGEAGPEPTLAEAGDAFTLSASDLDDIARTERATKPPRPGFPAP